MNLLILILQLNDAIPKHLISFLFDIVVGSRNLFIFHAILYQVTEPLTL